MFGVLWSSRRISCLYFWIGFTYWTYSYTAVYKPNLPPIPKEAHPRGSDFPNGNLSGVYRNLNSILEPDWFAAMIQDLEILDSLLKKGYDRRATPTNHYNSTSPTTAYVSIIVSSISSPSPMSMDYKTDLYLRQKWKDERLKHEDLKQPLDLSDPNLVKAIWKPEIYFPNAKEADFHFVTVPNVLVRIHPDGEILYMLRLRVTFSCMMDLSKFPLDRHTCTMEVASFSKTVEELLLEWVPDKPVRTTPVELNLFQLDKIETKYCRPESSAQIGNYSCLVAEFYLSRSLGFHLVQSYLPTILMVVISWVSFWMDVNSVPGRVTLGITTLLTVSSISTSIQENLPQASYVKAIDVWLGTCTAFVFLALLEFTFVNYLFRRTDFNEYLSEDGCRTYTLVHQHTGNYSDHNCSSGVNGCRKLEKYDEAPSTCSTIVQQVRDREEGKLSNHLEPQFVGVSSPDHSSLCDANYPPIPSEDISANKESLPKKKKPVQDPQTQARNIDETCRYAFPVAFALFNCIYWPYYLCT